MNKPHSAKYLRISLTVFGFGFGLLGLLFFLTPYRMLLSIANQLAADGTAESFSLNLVLIIKGVIALLTTSCFIIASIFVLRPSQSENLIINSLKAVSSFLAGVKGNIHSILIDLSPQTGEKAYLIGLVIITVFSVWFRYVYLWRPMAHDEAYTFVGFASRSLSYIITDYHAPNNHVLHSILTHIAYRIFGSEPWVVRLTAFMAGIAVVPSAYLAARVFYSPSIALISSTVLAYLPVMVDYSTNARGYSLVALFSVLLIPIGAYVKDNRNGVGWSLLILVSVLGFYTTPIMLYPAGIIFLWLFLSYLIGDTSHQYNRKFLLFLFISGAVILIIVILLYLPILLHSGLASLIGNDVVQALSWREFTASILPRIRSTWAEWNRNIPVISVWILLLGMLLSLFLPSLPKNRRINLLFPTVLWLAIALTIQRVAPWPRIWLFLVPLLVILMVAGWVGLIDWSTKFLSKRKLWAIAVSSLIALVIIGAGFSRSISYATYKMKQPGEVEKAVLFIRDNYPGVNHIYAISPDLAILDYYLLRYGISNSLTGMDLPTSPDDSLVITNDHYDQTIDYVLEKRGFKDNLSEISFKEIYFSDPIRIYSLTEVP